MHFGCHLQTDADPHPAYHFDADPKPGSGSYLSIWCGSGSTTLCRGPKKAPHAGQIRKKRLEAKNGGNSSHNLLVHSGGWGAASEAGRGRGEREKATWLQQAGHHLWGQARRTQNQLYLQASLPVVHNKEASLWYGTYGTFWRGTRREGQMLTHLSLTLSLA